MGKYEHDRPANGPGDRSSDAHVDQDRIPRMQHGRRGDEGSHTGSSPPTDDTRGSILSEGERRERRPSA